VTKSAKNGFGRKTDSEKTFGISILLKIGSDA
jgi:hypothetical protein